jgi:hypothetical protein
LLPTLFSTYICCQQFVLCGNFLNTLKSDTLPHKSGLPHFSWYNIPKLGKIYQIRYH